MKLKRPEMNFNLSLSREFTLREKILFGVLALLLLCVLYFYTVHMPVTSGIENAQASRDEIEAELTILQAEKERMNALQAELDESRSGPSVVTIPNYDNLDLLMSFLNGVLGSAEEYSLSFSGVSMPGEEGGNIARRYMQLTFTSPDYPSARAIINQLQGAPYRCLLNETSITPAKGGNDASEIFSGAVQVNLSMVFYEVVS